MKSNILKSIFISVIFFCMLFLFKGNINANNLEVSTVTLEKIDALNSKPIPNCKFELSSLETSFKTYDTTDKNGKCIFENVPYGKYNYREIEVTNEYNIDKTPHEIEVSSKNTEIEVRDDRNVYTGDINVIIYGAIIVLSLAGIALLLIINKKIKMNENN